ncbi:hypothetical protein [Rubrobacter indicoceani]|uniref:hypothetical protein n=1 Tax=Rubrobacter indicoceani TaxID=2051957 RepID=UPI0013C4B3A5|nr:hypothetical protein [Rubrobacter indicoceani]
MFQRFFAWLSQGWLGEQSIVVRILVWGLAAIVAISVLDAVAPLMFFVILLASVVLLILFVIKLVDRQPSLTSGLGSAGAFALALVFGLMWFAGASAGNVESETASGQSERQKPIEETPPPEELKPVEDPVEDFKPVVEEAAREKEAQAVEPEPLEEESEPAGEEQAASETEEERFFDGLFEEVEPDPVVEPDPIVLSGAGPAATEPVQLESGLAVMTRVTSGVGELYRGSAR